MAGGASLYRGDSAEAKADPSAKVAGKATCDETNSSYSVDWSVENKSKDLAATISGIAVDNGTAPALGTSLAAGGKNEATQAGVPVNFGSVTLSLTVTWTDGTIANYSEKENRPNNCGGSIQVHKYLPKENPPEAAPWQNQGNGAGKWEFQVYGDAAGTIKVGDPFHQLGPNSGEQYPMDVDLWIKEIDTGGDTFVGFFFPDNIPAGSGGNAHCNQQPLDGSTLSKAVLTKIPKEYWNQPGNQTGLLHICAYDKPTEEPDTGTVIVMKVITNDSADTTTTFSGTLKTGGVDVDGSPFTNLKQGIAGAKNFNDLAMGTYALVETPATAGFNLLGYKAGSGTTAPTCPAAEGLASSISATLANGGDVKVLCIYNEGAGQPTGSLVIHKQKTATSPADATTVFSGTVDSNSALPWSLTGIGGQSAAITLPAGAHTVQEVAANGWTRADGGLLALATGSAAPTCSTNPADYTLSAATITNGATTHVCILNEKQEQVLLRTLFVNKVILSSDPDNTAVFGGVVDSAVALPWATTNGVAVQVANNLNPGVYHVHEDPKAGYSRAGFRVVYTGSGTVCPATPVAGTEGIADLSGLNTVATVCVYNQAFGSIEVTKTTVTSHNGAADQPAPQDRDGWKITVNSANCGVGPIVGYTDTNGRVTFTNLPVCSDYIVAEDLSAPGAPDYVPVGLSSVSGVTPANPATQVSFLNRRATFDTFVFETPVPVPPTPVPPTPVPPTATPEPPKIDVVLGEKTPDILATPIAPVTGTGAPAGGNSANVLFILIGTVILGTGFALANASRGRNNN